MILSPATGPKKTKANMTNQHIKRHRRIYEKALFLDAFIKEYQKVRGRKTFPHKEVRILIHFLFPGSSISGRGAFKTVHKVYSRARHLVLKTSSPKNIRNDWRAYNKIPETLRNRYFAKIYWKTKYCLLQQFGTKRTVPPKALCGLKRIAREHELTDIRPANIRKVDGHFKVFV